MRSGASNSQNSPRVSVIWPRMRCRFRPPSSSTGASASGRAKDALMSSRSWLAVGRRCASWPLSQESGAAAPSALAGTAPINDDPMLPMPVAAAPINSSRRVNMA